MCNMDEMKIQYTFHFKINVVLINKIYFKINGIFTFNINFLLFFKLLLCTKDSHFKTEISY